MNRRKAEKKALVNFGLNPSVITQAASFFRKEGFLQSVAWIEDQKICRYNITPHQNAAQNSSMDRTLWWNIKEEITRANCRMSPREGERKTEREREGGILGSGISTTISAGVSTASGVAALRHPRSPEQLFLLKTSNSTRRRRVHRQTCDSSTDGLIDSRWF